MAGPGIRAWEIARSLADEFPVVLAAPAVNGDDAPGFRVVAYARNRRAALSSVVRDARLVVVQGTVLAFSPWIADANVPLVVDLYDPFHLESLHLFSRNSPGYQRLRHSFDLSIIQQQLREGDFFVCASEQQRHFWLGMLSSLGRVGPAGYRRDPTFRALIDVVPFGIPREAPQHTRPVLKGCYPGIGADDQVLLWGGGLWEWLDPLLLIRAARRLRSDYPRLKVFFMGTRRPGGGAAGALLVDAAQRLTRELNLEDVVLFNDWVEYRDRQNFLLESDIGVSLSKDHLENTFAFRTRMLDYMWCCLPIVCTNGDATADLVERHGLGVTLPPSDEDQLVLALKRLLDDPGGRNGRRQRFEALREQLSWMQATRPLREFARQPELRRDRQTGQVSRLLHMALKRSRRGLWLMQAARVSYATGGTQGFLRDLARMWGKRV
jgi:glycosyltransferase involved in cell wall biosynthesis